MYPVIICIGMAFGAIGDLFGPLSYAVGDWSFLVGMLLQLIMHIAYLMAMSLHVRVSWVWQFVGLELSCAFVAIIMYSLSSGLSKAHMLVPAVIYAVVQGLTAWRAWMRVVAPPHELEGSAGRWLPALGISLLLLADWLIGVQMWSIHSMPFLETQIFAAYRAGQVLIAASTADSLDKWAIKSPDDREDLRAPLYG